RVGRRRHQAPASPCGSPSSMMSSSAVSASNKATLLLLRHQIVLRGEEGQLEAIADAKLLEDVGQVMLDGLLADVERVGDLLVARRREDQTDDLQLARGEADGRRRLRRGAEIVQRNQQIR